MEIIKIETDKDKNLTLDCPYKVEAKRYNKIAKVGSLFCVSLCKHNGGQLGVSAIGYNFAKEKGK